MRVCMPLPSDFSVSPLVLSIEVPPVGDMAHVCVCVVMYALVYCIVGMHRYTMWRGTHNRRGNRHTYCVRVVGVHRYTSEFDIFFPVTISRDPCRPAG